MINLINKLPKDVKKSVTDQLKLLSWAMGWLNGLLRDEIGIALGMALAVSCWALIQFSVHYIMYMSEKGDAE